MKVTLNDNQSQLEKEIKYPILAKNINNAMIAYFMGEHIAVILDKGANSFFEGGEFCDNLIGVEKGSWEILPKGVTITLENE